MASGTDDRALKGAAHKRTPGGLFERARSKTRLARLGHNHNFVAVKDLRSQLSSKVAGCRRRRPPGRRNGPNSPHLAWAGLRQPQI